MISRYHVKMLGMVSRACNLSDGEVETWRSLGTGSLVVSFRQKRAGVSKGWTAVLKTRLSSGLYTHAYKHGFAVFFLREK